MHIKDIFAGFFAAAQESGLPIEGDELAARQLAEGEKLAEGALPAGSKAAPVAGTLLEAQVDPQVAELRAELAAMRAQRIRQDAQGWVTSELGAGRLLPAEQAAALALYTRAAELDATTVQQSGMPTSVELVQAAYAARPANRMASHLLGASTPATVLPASTNAAQAGMADEVADAKAWAEKMNAAGTK